MTNDRLSILQSEYEAMRDKDYELSQRQGELLIEIEKEKLASLVAQGLLGKVTWRVNDFSSTYLGLIVSDDEAEDILKFWGQGRWGSDNVQIDDANMYLQYDDKDVFLGGRPAVMLALIKKHGLTVDCEAVDSEIDALEKALETVRYLKQQMEKARCQ